MDSNKILSADLIDLVFDNRNKNYGAYELRKKYSSRLTRATLASCLLIPLLFAGVVLANKRNTHQKPVYHFKTGVILSTIVPPDRPLPPPPAQRPQPPVRTEQYTTNIRLVPPEEEIDQLPTQEDLTDAQVGLADSEGPDYAGIATPATIEDPGNIIQPQKPREPEILGTVDIDAKFDGDWQKFLLRNLNPQTPIDNNAPAGNYTVWIQFVVDTDGSISDIRALTQVGYGLEQEAIRVIRRTKKWEPAIQNGRPVKAYRKQAITFQVAEE